MDKRFTARVGQFYLTREVWEARVPTIDRLEAKRYDKVQADELTVQYRSSPTFVLEEVEDGAGV